MKFEELKINEQVLGAIREKGFENLFEIQEKSIPLLLENEIDFVGQQSQTSSCVECSLCPQTYQSDPSENGCKACAIRKFCR